MKPTLFLLLVGAVSASINAYWSEEDTNRLAKIFKTTLASKNAALGSSHYAASGLKLLNIDAPADSAKSACEAANSADLKDIKSLYHASAISGDLPNCALKNVAAAKDTVSAVAISNTAKGEQLLQALSTADRLKITVDKAAFDKALTAALKDETPANLASVFNAAAFLGKELSAKYLEKASLILKQAVEVDKSHIEGKKLVTGGFYYSLVAMLTATLLIEGGLPVVANTLHGLLSIAALQGKTGALTQDHVEKMTRYLMSRKHIAADKSAYAFLRALGVLANSKQAAPVSVLVKGPSVLTKDKSARLLVKNVIGLPVSVTAVKVTMVPASGGDPIQTFVLNKAADGLYDLPLAKAPHAGAYDIRVAVASQDLRLVGLAAQVRVVVVEDVVVDDLQLGVGHKDDTAVSPLTKVQQFSKFGKVLEVTTKDRVNVKFSVKTKAEGKSVKPHQAFLVLVHSTGAEVVYTADVATDGSYLIDINLGKSYKDFDGLSGKFAGRLVIGGAGIKTPIDWHFADFSITVPSVYEAPVPKSHRIVYEALPEISHFFRLPEKRPPGVVSDAFTIICLAPLGLLFVLWLRIGLNFGNMPTSIWVLVFHISLAALFFLYFVFWVQLDMFETLKYLAIVGTVTFVSGNRMLRAIADNRKQKSD